MTVYRIYAVLFLAAIPAFIAVFALRELAGIRTYPLTLYGIMTVGVFSILVAEAIWFSRKAK
jgi:hypothetical protein